MLIRAYVVILKEVPTSVCRWISSDCVSKQCPPHSPRSNWRSSTLHIQQTVSVCVRFVALSNASRRIIECSTAVHHKAGNSNCEIFEITVCRTDTRTLSLGVSIFVVVTAQDISIILACVGACACDCVRAALCTCSPARLSDWQQNNYNIIRNGQQITCDNPIVVELHKIGRYTNRSTPRSLPDTTHSTSGRANYTPEINTLQMLNQLEPHISIGLKPMQCL